MIVNVIARIIVQRGRLKDVDLDVDIAPDIGGAAAQAQSL